VGAGGRAILSAAPDEEVERILEVTAARLANFGKLDLDQQRAAVGQTREDGYALVKNRVTLGVTAIGIPFRDSMQRPIGALSVGAIDSRMGKQRRATVAQLLNEQARGIESAIRKRNPVFVER
jgi:DNA-binding IclR family transcriptional regulator